MAADIIKWITDTVFALGYPGIAALMFIESSFIPFPSEVILPPAGYLVAQGRMSGPGVLIAGLTGSLLGALFNYYFAVFVGEPVLRKYGKYVLLKPAALDKAERFFRTHGEIGTFVGRLVPVVRQLISVPAGMARMNLARFLFYTGLGAGAWCGILVYIGWWLGRHQAALTDVAVLAGQQAHRWFFFYVLPALIVIVVAYWWWYRRQEGRQAAGRAEPQQ